jgi:hypothetical protein
MPYSTSLPASAPDANELHTHAAAMRLSRVLGAVARLVQLDALVDVRRMAAVALATLDALVEMQQIHAA